MNTQRRSMKTKGALRRLFGNRKHRPCAYCGKTLTVETATFDHVVAISAGGYDKTRNGAIACNTCNQRKGSMSAEDYRRILALHHSEQGKQA